MTADTSEGIDGFLEAEAVTDHSDHPHAHFSDRIRNLAEVCLAAGVFVFGGIIASGILSISLFVVGLVMFLYGSYLVLSPPTYRFEIGTYRAGHQYNGVTITAEVEIHYDDEGVKRRMVECAALAEDGTTIIRESDNEPVGTKPDAGLDGGDFDGVQSTTDHVLVIATSVHEYVDEWLGAGGNDMEIKTSLETEFGTINSEMEQAMETENL